MGCGNLIKLAPGLAEIMAIGVPLVLEGEEYLTLAAPWSNILSPSKTFRLVTKYFTSIYEQKDYSDKSVKCCGCTADELLVVLFNFLVPIVLFCVQIIVHYELNKFAKFQLIGSSMESVS